MPPPSLMVLGGNARVTLGLVRALGQLGIPIMARGEDLAGAGGLSRYCRHWFTHPPSGAGVAATHAVVIDRVRQWRPDVLLPVFTHAWHVVYAFSHEEALVLAQRLPYPVLLKPKRGGYRSPAARSTMRRWRGWARNFSSRSTTRASRTWTSGVTAGTDRSGSLT